MEMTNPEIVARGLTGLFLLVGAIGCIIISFNIFKDEGEED